MTLGQHIQFLRKNAGLSQESLGEALGVSRQAVSKWEADGAIPELDTLIAMSRLFGVSLGQLLQLEEPTQNSAPDQTEPEPVQNDRLEELLRSYVNQNQASRSQQRRIQWAAAGLGLCLLIGGGLYAVNRITELQQNLYSLESQISNLRSSVNSEINDITYRISEVLEEQDNILADYSMTPVEVDIDKGALLYRLTASLKEINTASKGQFILNYTTTDGQTGSAESELLNGPQFNGAVWLPFNYHTDVMLLVTDPDGTQRTQKIDTIYDAHEEYYSIWGDAYMGYTTRPRSDDEIQFTVDGTCMVFYPDVPKSLDFELSLKEIKVELYHNDQLIESAEMVPIHIQSADDGSNTEAAIQIVPETQAVIAPLGEDQTYGLKEPFDFTLKVKEGDVIKAIFSMTDNHGRTIYDLDGRDKAIQIIKEKGRLSIQSVELTEDMLP